MLLCNTIGGITIADGSEKLHRNQCTANRSTGRTVLEDGSTSRISPPAMSIGFVAEQCHAFQPTRPSGDDLAHVIGAAAYSNHATQRHVSQQRSGSVQALPSTTSVFHGPYSPARALTTDAPIFLLFCSPVGPSTHTHTPISGSSLHVTLPIQRRYVFPDTTSSPCKALR